MNRRIVLNLYSINIFAMLISTDKEKNQKIIFLTINIQSFALSFLILLLEYSEFTIRYTGLSAIVSIIVLASPLII